MRVLTQADFLIQWRSYSRATGGCCTHATRQDSDTSLCGLEMYDSAGQALSTTNGLVGCRRCMKALGKLGVFAPQP